LNHPSAVCLDASSAVFIADTNKNRIRKVGADGKIQLVAGNGVAGYSGDAGLGTLASLNRPAAIEMSPDGDLYIADTGNHRIRRLSHGVIATIAGDGVPRFAGDGGPAVKASLISPSELALGSYGALYVLDRDSARIRRIDLVSGIISTVAGNGDHTTSGDGDSPLKAGLGAPQGLAVDSHDDLYVTDSQSSRLRVIHLSRQKSLRSIFFAR
jgi:sugar lactone lactonase YvrE